MSDAIATAVNNAVQYLTEHPDEAAYTDGPATATLESGLRVNVAGSDGESLITDMPTSVGGGNSAPSAGWMMRAAIAACEATLIAMRAAQQGVALGSVEVVVDSKSDDRGILGIDGSVPAGPASVRVAVKVSSDSSESDVRSVVEWAHDHCPVTDAVRRAVPTELQVEISG
ncbi:MAG: OsmC family protein [Actinomycetota bacterium]